MRWRFIPFLVLAVVLGLYAGPTEPHAIHLRLAVDLLTITGILCVIAAFAVRWAYALSTERTACARRRRKDLNSLEP